MDISVFTPKIRIISFLLCLFGGTAGLLLLTSSTWRGSDELHTNMEVLATTLALIVGMLSMVRYYSKKDTIFLFVGVGFIGAGFLDGYHAVVTATYFKALMPTDHSSLIAWSWVASRLYLSVILCISYIAWRKEYRHGIVNVFNERAVYIGTSVFTIFCFLFFIFVPLPRAYFPEIFFHRPEEFGPALFFLLALIGYLNKKYWRTNAFEFWLVISLIIGFMSQAVFMPLSGEVFDYQFDIAHILKKFSYICVLIGLVISFYIAFKNEEKSNKSLIKSQFELRERETRVRTIVSTVVDGIITIDSKGIVDTMNPAAVKIFGYQENEVVGRNIKCLMPEPYQSEHDGYLGAYLSTGKEKIIGIGREVEGKRKDGSVFPMDLAVNRWEVAGKTMFTGIVRDISERKEIDKMKSEFVSTVSHELRTPLTSIRGSLGLITTGVLGDIPDKMKRMLELAENNTSRLITLVNELLDMERLQSGELEFRMSKVDLNQILKNSIENNKPFADQYHVTFHYVSSESELYVMADQGRISQVMANLLSNASKFSPEGGTVDVSLEQKNGNYRVNISDQGTGIPEEFRKTLFDRFTQIDSSDTRQKGGTGLGLHISMMIIKKHKGIIDFEPNMTSGKEAGTTFFFDIPKYGSDPTIKKEPPLMTPSYTKPQIVKGDRILVIEDDPDIATLIGVMISEYGADCDTVASMTEAREKLAENVYQAITLDMLLPDGRGVDMLLEIRANKDTKDIPIVVVSAVCQESRDEVISKVTGVVDWLEKPIDEKRLIRAIKRSSDYTKNHANKVLIIEDDHDLSEVLTALISNFAEVSIVGTYEDAVEQINSGEWSLIVLDIGLPDGSGFDLIPLIKSEQKTSVPIIIFSGEKVGVEIAKKVDHVFLKSQTSNEELLSTIVKIIV